MVALLWKSLGMCKLFLFCPIPTVLSALLTWRSQEKIEVNLTYQCIKTSDWPLRMEGSQGVIVTWWCHCSISRFWILTKFRTKSISDWTSCFLSPSQRQIQASGDWFWVLMGVHTCLSQNSLFFIFLDPGRSDGWLEECYMQAFARRSILAFFLVVLHDSSWDV